MKKSKFNLSLCFSLPLCFSLSLTACSYGYGNSETNSNSHIGDYRHDDPDPSAKASDGATASSNPPSHDTAAHSRHDENEERHDEAASSVDWGASTDHTFAAHQVVVLSASGDVCVADPENGMIRSVQSLSASDLITDPSYPQQVVLASVFHDAYAEIATYKLQNDALELVDRQELTAYDVKVVHGPGLVMGLAVTEGTTLFCGDEGRTVFTVASVLSGWKKDNPEVWLLADDVIAPRLAHFAWNAGLRLEGDEPTGGYGWTSQPRLVRDASEPLIMGTVQGGIEVQLPTGERVGKWEMEPTGAMTVQDALWIGGSDDESCGNVDDETDDNAVVVGDRIAVLTGPRGRLYLLELQRDDLVEAVDFEVMIGEDLTPQRKLAFDRGRKRVWVALSKSLRAVDIGEDGRLTAVSLTSGCSARSVGLVSE